MPPYAIDRAQPKIIRSINERGQPRRMSHMPPNAIARTNPKMIHSIYDRLGDGGMSHASECD